MNISLSYNWIREYCPTELSAEDFAARLSLRGPSVERVLRPFDMLDGIIVGRVVDVRPHPNADKLRLASVDAGKEVLEVVCGGANLAAGMKVAFARIGSRVRWHGEGELVELKPAEIRGVRSYGMICAANEVGLFDFFPHAEREIMDLSSITAPPGTLLGAALGLDDAVLDIEVTTNRIDAFSVIGIAREAAAILGVPFSVIPAFKAGISKRHHEVPARNAGTTNISVAIEAKRLCPRYQAAVVHGVNIGPSPLWMKQRLMASGLRPINAAVDVANYVMLELGHPLHTFDAATLAKRNLIVREARSGEEISALDGKTYGLTPGMLVIADAERPVAIAGIMGSEASGVRNTTTEIVIESAAFDPVSVRSTARALGIVSDAALRFEKGIHPESTAAALARATRLLVDVCGGESVGAAVDVRAHPWKPRTVVYRPAAAGAIVGTVIDAHTQRRALAALGFGVRTAGKTWKVTVPWWRDADIEDGERDIIEEATRIFGYDRIPETLPHGFSTRTRPEEFDGERALKEFFRGIGCIEVQTLPLVSEAWAPEGLVLANPLAADASRMRTSLIPSLLDVIAKNQEHDREFSLFEIGRIFLPRAGDLPEEPTMLAALAAGPSPAGEQFALAAGMLESFGHRFGIAFETAPADPDFVKEQSLHPGRCLAIHAGGHEVGFVGEIDPFAARRFGVEVRVAVLSLDLAFTLAARAPRSVSEIPEFPEVKRDISFTVPVRTRHADIIAAIASVAAMFTSSAHDGNLKVSATLFDVFSGNEVPVGKKSMAYHVAFSAPDRTLTAAEAVAIEGKIIAALEKKFGAEIRI